jgi:hypothetical protein
MRKTAAPYIASFFKALNARLASFKGKTWTCVRIGILAASARNSWPSCRVLFAETWGQAGRFLFSLRRERTRLNPCPLLCRAAVAGIPPFQGHESKPRFRNEQTHPTVLDGTHQKLLGPKRRRPLLQDPCPNTVVRIGIPGQSTRSPAKRLAQNLR